MSTTNKHVPKDAQVIMSILKELNIHDYEPRIINQLLEFTYRYVTCVLDDAKIFANHARKKAIDMDDIKLATELVLDKAFTGPPSRHVLSKLAEVRNEMPLPPIRPHCGLRLPPDRYCLTACNYKLRASNPPKKMTKSALEGRSTLKTQMKSSASGISNPSGPLKRQTMSGGKQTIVTIPKPVIKFTTSSKSVPVDIKVSSGDGVASTSNAAAATSNVAAEINIIKMDEETAGTSSVSLKREREDDEFETQ